MRIERVEGIHSPIFDPRLCEAGAMVRTKATPTLAGWYVISLRPSGSHAPVRHAATASAPGVRSHDQPRQTLLNRTAHDWLEGLEVVDAIAAVETNAQDRPIKEVRILSMRILQKNIASIATNNIGN